MLRRLAAASAFVFFCASPLRAGKAFPAPPVNYVYNEGVVSAAGEERLSRFLTGFEASTGHQFVVALFQSMDGESLEDYSNKLFRAWKIGSKKNDDGLLFVLFKDDRRWRVEVGYGLESTLTDLEAADIVRSRAVPYFKTGDFDDGVLAAVEGLAGKLGSTEPTRIRPLREGPDLGAVAGVIGAILFALYLCCLAYESARSSTIGGRGAAAAAVLDVLSIVFNVLSIALSGGGGGSGGGGFSGGGGSSGGGGASGGW